jgi:hypothetical protein
MKQNKKQPLSTEIVFDGKKWITPDGRVHVTRLKAERWLLATTAQTAENDSSK